MQRKYKKRLGKDVYMNEATPKQLLRVNSSKS